MKGRCRADGRGKALAVLLSAAVLAGCAGPSTRVLPKGVASSKETQEEIPLLEDANPFYIRESFIHLSESPRPSGSSGEMNAVGYMEQLLKDYGYQVERQAYTYETETGPVEGCNLSAVRTSDNPDGDILLIGTWHDTALASPGAGKNGSGAAVLLEIARLLSDLPTDTELRFVSFSGHLDGLIGVRHYVSRLSSREKERMIGAIMLEPSGYQAGGELVIGTADGKHAMAGDMLQEASGLESGRRWNYQAVPGKETSVFMREEIPAVSVGQRFQSYEADTPLDLPASVDGEALAQTVDIICTAAAELMDPDTPSMMAKSHSYNDRDYSFVQTKDTPSWFGETIETVETGTGRTGMHLTVNMDNQGRTIEKYQFRMKWFGVDQLIMTDYYFTDGRLDLIVPEAAEAGIGFEEMKSRIEAFYGAPAGENTGPNGTEYDWQDPAGRRFFALIPAGDSYTLEIREYRPEPVLLEEHAGDGSLLGAGSADSRCGAYMELLSDAMLSGETVGKIAFFTDGAGGQTAYLTASEDGDGQEAGGWELYLDPADAFYQNGDWKDYTGTVKQLAGFYGQILEKSEPELAAQYGALLEMVKEKRQGAAETGAAPGSHRAETGSSPDFVTAFTMFVLTDEPDGTPGEWKEEIGFFYQNEACVNYRSQVRQNLKLQTEESTETQ